MKLLIKRAVASVLMSKTFDNGVICASEQSVVVVDSVYDAVRERFATHGGYLLQGKELKAVQDVILKNGALNAAIVGQPAYTSNLLNWQASLYQKTPRF